MSRRVVAGIAALGVLAVAGFGAWYFLIRSDAPAAVNLQDALAAASTATATASTDGTPAANGTGTATADGTPSAADLAAPGTWTVAGGGLSFVGYRVEEQLANIGANTAVGRTEAVTGTLAFDGSTITSVDITADLSQLKSDESRRDRALQSQSLETGSFPTATFALTSPIEVATPPAEGSTLSTTVEGDLTIHGVTKPVSIQLDGQVANGRLVVVGSTTVQLSDFGISPPRAPAVLSVADSGIIEMQLVFERAS